MLFLSLAMRVLVKSGVIQVHTIVIICLLANVSWASAKITFTDSLSSAMQATVLLTVTVPTTNFLITTITRLVSVARGGH